MGSSSGCERGPGRRSSPDDAGRGASASPPDPDRPPDRRFPGTHRLTARKQFLEVYDRGRRASSSSFVLFAMPNGLGHCRIGLTVTKKTGGAVARNRVKRRLREIYRTNREQFDVPLDLVVNARPSIKERSFDDLERELLRAYRRLVRGGGR